jgi:predicted RNase H-like HicB family nuclease
LRRHLAVPYVAVVYSVEQEDGQWLRRAEYPELQGCVVEAFSIVDAMERLEDMRVQTIVNLLKAGQEPPTPREPLSSGTSGLSERTLQELLQRAGQSVAPR